MSEEPVAFASGEWFKKAQEKLRTSEDFKKAAATWEGGVVRCVIDVEDDNALLDYRTEVGIRGFVSMVELLSEEDRLKYKETNLEKLANKVGYSFSEDPASADIPSIVKKAVDFTIDDFKGCVVYASWWTDRGVLKEMDPIAPDAHPDAPFTLSGSYSAWKQLCNGEQTAIQLIMGGNMKLEGNLKYIMKHMAAVNQLAEVYKSIPLK
ncbi:MAG TPA: SCP2 sterol-binding domain-containing protein [Candidatus Anoxymicrobiaceae bacterium]|jgi:putative sterol carrier protein